MNIDNEQANEIIKNAQEKAKGIIEVAQAKANKILSESFLLKQIQEQADKIKQEILDEQLKLKKVSDELFLTKYYQTKKMTDDCWCVQKDKNGKFAVINKYNKTILPAEYDYIDIIEGVYTLFFIKKGDYVGLSDLEGFVLIDPNKYTDLIPQENGLFKVQCKDENFYYINIYNKKVENNELI